MVIYPTATMLMNISLRTGDFIDSSKLRLKAVVLQNGNDLQSIPVAHTVHMKSHMKM
jgi:hypothetical protein